MKPGMVRKAACHDGTTELRMTEGPSTDMHDRLVCASLIAFVTVDTSSWGQCRGSHSNKMLASPACRRDTYASATSAAHTAERCDVFNTRDVAGH